MTGAARARLLSGAHARAADGDARTAGWTLDRHFSENVRIRNWRLGPWNRAVCGRRSVPLLISK